MARYVASARDPVALYIWDTRLSKAYLEDIAHMEVLLRNFLATRLAAGCGQNNWYDPPASQRYRLSPRFRQHVAAAQTRIATKGYPVGPGRVIAELTLGDWLHLLDRRLEPFVWKTVVDPANGGTPHYPGHSRPDMQRHVHQVAKLRNRCAHQEPLISPNASVETSLLDGYAAAVHWVARRLDPDADAWITTASRLDTLRSSRPPR